MKLDQHLVEDSKLPTVVDEVKGISVVRSGAARLWMVAHLHRKGPAGRLNLCRLFPGARFGTLQFHGFQPYNSRLWS